MKLRNILFFAAMLAMAGCGEEDPEFYSSTGVDDTAEDFEMLLLNSATTDIVLEKNTDGEVKTLGASVAMAAAPKGGGLSYSYKVVEQSSTSGLDVTTSGEIPAGQTIGTLPIMVDLDEFEIGVPNTVTLQLEEQGGINVNTTPVQYTFTVVCPSDLAGTYNAVAVGTSTDDCCPDEVTTSGEVTLTGSAGSYTLSDFSGGLYLDWYGPAGGNYGIVAEDETSGRLAIMIGDVCGDISGTTTEPFSTEVTLTGTAAANGVITYTWVNGYDDTGTVTLTPQ